MVLANAQPFAAGLRETAESAMGRYGHVTGGREVYRGAADHGVLADFLHEHDDPREDLVRGQIDGPYGPDAAAFAKARTSARSNAALGSSTHRGIYRMPDGTLLNALRYAGHKGTHWGVVWSPGGGAPSYAKHMPHAEFKAWLKRFPRKVALEIAKSIKQFNTERPVRLARERVPGPGAAIRDTNSANHEKRVEIAKQILSEAGLNPSVVRKALAHSGEQAQAAVVQIVQQRVDPARVKFAAAWYGLMSNSPAVTVFHPTAGGEDSLHVINSPHTSDHVAAYLRRAGVPKFTTESRAGGTRAYVFDPGSRLPIADFARGLDASHSQFAGVGYRLGSGPGAGATAGGTAGSAGSRATYRDAIRDFESAANGQ